MRLFFSLALIGLFTSLSAQETDGYWIGLEAHAVHTEGDLAGMTTWRMYLNLLNPEDFLSACSGSEEHPFILESTSTPAWYQHPYASETFATGINPSFFSAFPDLEYDSWFTIGVEDSSTGMYILSIVDPTYDAFVAFEAGENVYSDSPVGNLWATLYPGLGADSPGFAGDELRILIAQITTAGSLSGTIYVQIFPMGIQDPDIRLQLSFASSSAQPGCTDSTSCNFNEDATFDDGSCISSGCMYADACNFNPEAECEGEVCDYTCCPGPGCCNDGTIWDVESQTCIVLYPSDSNFDGCVDLDDLLDLLVDYGICL